MSVTLTGIIGLPLLNVATLLANCAMFRTLTGAADVNAALAKMIYIESDESDPDQAALPRCIVGFCPFEFGSELNGTTTWTTKGPLEARIEVLTPEEYLSDKQDEAKWFANSLSDLFDQIRGLATSGQGYLNVVNLRLGMCGRLDAEEYNNVRGMGAELIFEWRGP